MILGQWPLAPTWTSFEQGFVSEQRPERLSLKMAAQVHGGWGVWSKALWGDRGVWRLNSGSQFIIVSWSPHPVELLLI